MKKEMKVVIDINVFVSSFFWKGNPRKVVSRVIEGIDELYITKEILGQIFEVMNRPKFKTNKESIEYYIKSIEEIAVELTNNFKIEKGSRDIDDNIILECGIMGRVDYIISGDDDLLVLKEFSGIKIVTPKEYLEILNF
jgi:putative PIN family toxin of toxin-antitoxin system